MKTILDAIGSTPLIQIDDIWVKLEFLNPSGSIKARIAKYMIERAEREGLLVVATLTMRQFFRMYSWISALIQCMA